MWSWWRIPKYRGWCISPQGITSSSPTPPRKWQSPQKRQNPERNLQLKNKTWNRTTNIEQSGDVGNKNDDDDDDGDNYEEDDDNDDDGKPRVPSASPSRLTLKYVGNQGAAEVVPASKSAKVPLGCTTTNC